MDKSKLEWLDFLWHVAIKSRANFKSEISGITADVSHHILHKPNLHFRFSLVNGIALTNWEHEYLAHKKEKEFYERIKLIRNEDELTELIIKYRWTNTIPNLDEVYNNLIKIIAEKKDLLDQWLKIKKYSNKELLLKYKRLQYEINSYNTTAS